MTSKSQRVNLVRLQSEDDLLPIQGEESGGTEVAKDGAEGRGLTEEHEQDGERGI